jgi:hypothetical protein
MGGRGGFRRRPWRLYRSSGWARDSKAADGAPDQVYGRPLFQGLSYHDMPFAPLPQMRHVDTSAKAGVKHVYTVIALNSAGVPSVVSLPATVA